MKSEAYMKIYRRISLIPLQRVLSSFTPEQISEYLKVFSDLELDGWNEDEVQGLVNLFVDMERWLHNHYGAGND